MQIPVKHWLLLPSVFMSCKDWSVTMPVHLEIFLQVAHSSMIVFLECVDMPFLTSFDTHAFVETH